MYAIHALMNSTQQYKPTKHSKSVLVNTLDPFRKPKQKDILS